MINLSKDLNLPISRFKVLKYVNNPGYWAMEKDFIYKYARQNLGRYADSGIYEAEGDYAYKSSSWVSFTLPELYAMIDADIIERIG